MTEYLPVTAHGYDVYEVVRMFGNRNVRQNLTAVDAAIGTSTIAAFIADVALLMLFLSTAWSGSGFTTYAIFVLTQLLLGTVVAFGIVLRALGDSGRLANRWSPMSLIALRSAAVVTAMLAAVFDWADVDSLAFVSLYLVPTTALLVLLSFANLLHRVENRQ